MKRFAVLGLAALLVVALTLPAAAMEFSFGGYWRTRGWTEQNFDGDDSDNNDNDYTAVDTRTRLYLTATFHENLKFVNKFEFDADWGSASDGDIGIDNVEVEVKNSYVDFNLGPLNVKVGGQYFGLARGFIFADDAYGAIVAYKGNNIVVPLMWIRGFEGNSGETSLGDNTGDFDYYGIAPSFSGGSFSVTPYVLYATSDRAADWSPTTHAPDLDSSCYTGDCKTLTLAGAEDLDVFYGGLDIDLNFDPVSIWLTGIYQTGEYDILGTNDSVDIEAWLGALGGSFGMGFGDIHFQAFWAQGDDEDTADEIEAFFVPSQNDWSGQSYYWAEIMGYGIFDDRVSNHSPADKISDIMAANLGVTIKPMPKLSISLDAWYARKDDDIKIEIDTSDDDDSVESNLEESELGTEVDLKITYELIDNLKLDIVGAYLFAGEATTLNNPDEADPYEIGSRLSLSF